MKTPKYFKDLNETRFLFVLVPPNIIEEYPIKKVRGVPDSKFVDITIYKVKNTRTGNADAFDGLIKSVDDAQIPTLTIRVNMEGTSSMCNIKNEEIWTIFPSKEALLQFMEQGTGKNVKLV